MLPENFYNFLNPTGGVDRELAPGVHASVYTGEHAQVSIVRAQPNTEGKLHHHPQEQWTFCIEGGGTRFQGDVVVQVSAGDFWRTPSDVPHTVKAGPDGIKVIDVFAPPREAYKDPGTGFGTGDS